MSSNSGSSESDSEDDNRFKEACDPTFSILYGDSIKEISPYSPRPENNNSVSIARTSEEDRESFLLLEKIQSILALEKKTGMTVPHPGSERDCFGPSLPNSSKSKRNGLIGNDFPSNLSPFLAKQLAKVLDKKVNIQEHDCPVETLLKEKISNSEIFLVKGRALKSFIGDTQEDRTVRKDRLKSKFDKKAVALQCRSIALSPQDILEMRYDFPWPHPKNIRYLERYKVKSRKADGTIVAVPLDDAQPPSNKGQKNQKDSKENKSMKKEHKIISVPFHSESQNEILKMDSEKVNGQNSIANGLLNGNKVKKRKTQNQVVKTDSEQVNGQNCMSNGLPNGNEGKKRKQTKKRGGKKQKKNSFKLDGLELEETISAPHPS